ncbi:Thioredoxin-like protein [Gossypium arboreum]|uniref:Thioredoxin-like protein n=1 Tax=Gossypium arboreum TaxID=29729 RepID=A0A0B0PYC0_GOSAR|nr:Thioredoxin-like protein [Gossypium arboreum]
MYLNRIHVHIVINFLRMPVKPFRINKDTLIARQAHTMPMSQIWSYM